MDIEQCFHIDNAFISMNQFSGIPYSKSLEILILSPSNILAVICSRWLVAVRNGYNSASNLRCNQSGKVMDFFIPVNRL